MVRFEIPQESFQIDAIMRWRPQQTKSKLKSIGQSAGEARPSPWKPISAYWILIDMSPFIWFVDCLSRFLVSKSLSESLSSGNIPLKWLEFHLLAWSIPEWIYLSLSYECFFGGLSYFICGLIRWGFRGLTTGQWPGQSVRTKTPKNRTLLKVFCSTMLKQQHFLLWYHQFQRVHLLF